MLNIVFLLELDALLAASTLYRLSDWLFIVLVLGLDCVAYEHYIVLARGRNGA